MKGNTFKNLGSKAIEDAKRDLLKAAQRAGRKHGVQVKKTRDGFDLVGSEDAVAKTKRDLGC